MKMPNKNTRNRAALFFILAVFFAGGLVLLPVPFTRDQGIYAYNGWRWLADDVPYRDTFGHKGPLLYAVYGVVLDLAGGAMWAMNLADLLARTATVFFMYLLASRLFRASTGLLAALFSAFPLFGVFNSCWWNGQAETFIMPLVTASAWLAANEREKARGLAVFSAGLLAGAAVCLKPTAGFLALFLFFSLALFREQKSAKAVPGRSAALFLLGTAVAVTPWIFYFAYHSALEELWECLVLFNSFHARAMKFSELRPGGAAGRGFYTVFTLIPLLVPFMFLCVREESERRGFYFSLGFLGFALLSVFVQGKFFLYHWLLAVPAMGLCAGKGLDCIRERAAKLRWSFLAAALTAGVLTWVGFLYGRYWFWVEESYRTREYLLGRISKAEYYSRFNTAGPEGKGDFNLLADLAAAHYAKENIPPQGTLLVFGYEPLVNLLAAKPAPTRFQIDYPLTFNPRSEKARKTRQKWRREFMQELKRRPPDMIALVDNDQNAIEPKTSVQQAKEFKEFYEWLSRHYAASARIEDFQFYKLKNQEALPGG